MNRVQCLAVLLVLVFCSPSFASVTGDLDELRVASLLHRANRDRIRTWQGEARISERVESSKGSRVYEGSVQFAFDRIRDQAKWEWVWDSRIVEGRTVGSADRKLPPLVVKRIRNGSTFVDLMTRSHTKMDRIRIRSTSELSKLNMTENFEPFFFYGYRGRDSAEMLFVLHSSPNKIPRNWKATRDEHGLLNVELTADGRKGLYQFDMNRGGMFIHYRASRPDAVIEWNIDPVRQGEIWIPRHVSISKQQFNEAGKKTKLFVRDIDWVSNRLNEELPSQAFSIHAIADDGDIIDDTRLGLMMPYSPRLFRNGIRTVFEKGAHE